MRKTKKVLALIRRGHKALKKITTLKKLEKAVIALEQLAKIKTTLFVNVPVFHPLCRRWLDKCMIINRKKFTSLSSRVTRHLGYVVFFSIVS